MLCQYCHKRLAQVHFTHIINNSKVEMYLCEQCANEKGQFNIGLPLNINDFFNGFMGLSGANTYLDLPSVKGTVCEKCGMSYEEFQKTGKLGCDNCYEIYSERLHPLIKRLHGNSKHIGKLPIKISKTMKASKEIEKLKELLNRAIQNEEYEKAAELRDKIKSMEVGEG